MIDTEGLDDTGIGTLVALCAMDQPAIFVEGEQVGEGPEGEPLVEIDRWWPVPRDTDLGCNQPYAESALELWSSGPRDGSGVRLTQWRLGNHEAGYLPANMAPISLTGRRRIAHATQGKGAPNKKKNKAAKAARKKNRKR